MKAAEKQQCGLAVGCEVTGVFKSTAEVWPHTKPVANGKMGEEAQLAEEKPATWPQLLAAIVVNLNVFAFGSSMVWPAMALPQLLSAESGLRDLPMSADEASWVASLAVLATLVFVPVFSAASTHMGRKMLGYITVAPLLASWIIKMLSTSTEALYAARVLSGVQAAGSIMLTALYVSETTSDEVRGKLGCMLPLMCTSGILFSYVIGALLPYYVGLYVNVALPAIFVVCFVFMPETPYQLATVQRYEQARKALRWLRRGISEEQLGREMSRTQASLNGGKQGGAGRLTLKELSSRASVRGLAICVTLATNLQLCGSFTVLNYAVLMFDEAGGSLPSEVATIILGALQVVGAFTSSLVIDRLGRRPLLFVSNGVVGTCIAILGVYMYLKQETEVDISSFVWLPATCLSLYVLLHSFGLNSMPYVALSEVVSPRIRAVAAMATYTTNAAIATVMTKLYPTMSEAMGTYGTFWFFASVCLACSLIEWFLLPETKGRPLEDILKELNGGKDVIISSSQ